MLYLGGNRVDDVRGLAGVDLQDVPTTAIAGVAELRARGVYVGGLAG